MMKNIIAFLLWTCLLTTGINAKAQELFVYTEPASNMPAHSIGIRASNYFIKNQFSAQTTYQLLPELMWGVNKNLMLHVEGFGSNRTATFKREGVAIYAKYRFYSHDDVYRHFRLAAFARASTNNAHLHYEEIEINGNNSGYELGLIATQLLHKQAISATLSGEKIIDNADGNEIPTGRATQAINYSLSTGRLILPFQYKNYGQPNFNIMIELLGQSLPENGKTYIDIAPSLQLIINSQTRIDLGYRRELYSNMLRMSTESVLFRIEHLLFNVIKKWN